MITKSIPNWSEGTYMYMKQKRLELFHQEITNK